MERDRKVIRAIMDVAGSYTDAYIDLMLDLVDRAKSMIEIDEYEFNEAINQAIDDGMIYTDDQWTAYRHYCDMGDDPQIMWDGLFNDLYSIVEKVLETE